MNKKSHKKKRFDLEPNNIEYELEEISKRIIKLYEKYESNNRASSLFPVKFTGSTDDLRKIINSNRVALKLKEEKNLEPVILKTISIDELNENELNEWIKIFQEYWLTLTETFKKLFIKEEINEEQQKDDDPPNSKQFISKKNKRYRLMSIYVLLDIFERDVEDNSDLERKIITNILDKITFENKYLSKKMIENTKNQF